MKKFFFIVLTFFVSRNVFAAETKLSVDSLLTSGGHASQLPNPIMVLPFLVLLLLIATGPIFYKHYWERNYHKISILLGLVTVSYYLGFLNDFKSVEHSVTEYISFIALLTSLFIASGSILIKVNFKAAPVSNVLFLLFGAVISNLIGTTGASMLLIRPFIKMNRERMKPYLIIFFIFIISNIGGALTPIGDPPLFLGFLRGVPFFWVIENVFPIWLIGILLALLIFFLFDISNKKSAEAVSEKGKYLVELKGSKNVIYVAFIIIAVFIDPKVMSWVPSLSPLPFGIREIIMFSVAVASFKTADLEILKANEFDFEPIKEVAYLFVGIFLTMIPALQLIAFESRVYSHYLTQATFYWSTGALSSVLDNAPTYLNFLSAAMGKFGLDINLAADVKHFVTVDEVYLRAISVGAVFFGAMTYIGNGPNFMVKSISERAGIEMPSFFTYIIKYSLPILLPIFAIIWFLFFRG